MESEEGGGVFEPLPRREPRGERYTLISAFPLYIRFDLEMWNRIDQEAHSDQAGRQ